MTNTAHSRRPPGGFPCERTPEFKARKRANDRRTRLARRDEVAAQKRAYRARLDVQWQDALQRCGYLGSLEEYADYRERKALGCTNAAAWKAWMPQRPVGGASAAVTEAIDQATRAQRPVLLNGLAYWPKGWGSAMRFTWRYKHDAAFRSKQRDRQRLKRFADPRYAARHDRGSHWRRAIEQRGNLTRAHLRAEMQAKRCSYCLEPLHARNHQLDHIEPLSAGGEHADANIVAACRQCNRSKAAKSLVVWLLEGGPWKMRKVSGSFPESRGVAARKLPAFDLISPPVFPIRMNGGSAADQQRRGLRSRPSNPADRGSKFGTFLREISSGAAVSR